MNAVTHVMHGGGYWTELKGGQQIHLELVALWYISMDSKLMVTRPRHTLDIFNERTYGDPGIISISNGRSLDGQAL